MNRERLFSVFSTLSLMATLIGTNEAVLLCSSATGSLAAPAIENDTGRWPTPPRGPFEPSQGASSAPFSRESGIPISEPLVRGNLFTAAPPEPLRHRHNERVPNAVAPESNGATHPPSLEVVSIQEADAPAPLTAGQLAPVQPATAPVEQRTSPAPMSTPEPLPTSFPSPYGETAFQDDFSEPSSGWRVFHGDDDYTSEYLGGEYHMRHRQAHGHWFIWHPLEVGAFDLQVDARLARPGDVDGYGIMFGRTNDPDDSFYYALISPDFGAFVLARLSPSGSLEAIVSSTRLKAIRSGMAVNRLRLISDGSRIRFFVNGVPAFDILQPVPIAHIGFGLSGGSDNDLVDAYFDNLTMTAPPASRLTPPPLPQYSTPRFEDDFSHPESGWPEADEGGCLVEYAAGEYHMVATGMACAYGGAPSTGSSPFDLTVDARTAATSPGTLYGLTAGRIQGKFGVNFVIDPSNGSYSLIESVVSHANSVISAQIVPFTESPAIRRGAASNRLRLVNTNEYLVLLVNDVRLVSVRRSLLGSQVGLITFPPSGLTRAEAYFDNFRLMVPGLMPTPMPTSALPTVARPDPDVLFGDDFSRPTTGWPARSNLGYVDGEYLVDLSTRPGGQTVTSPAGQRAIERYEVSVAARIDKAPPGSGRSYSGLLFAYENGSQIGYLYYADPTRREYGVMRIIDGYNDPFLVIPWTPSRAIRPVGSWNRLRVARRNGTAVELYANDVLLTTFELPFPLDFSGVSATQTGASDGLVASFDDFEVRRPPEAAAAVAIARGARTPTPLHDAVAEPGATPVPGSRGASALYLPMAINSAEIAARVAATAGPAPTKRATSAPLPGSGGATLRASFGNPNALTSLAPDPSTGEVWAGSDGGGLLRWDVKTGTYVRFTAPRDLPDDRVLALARGTDGTLWVGTGNGAVTLSPRGTAFKPVERTPGDRIAGPVRAIHLQPDGSPWLAVGDAGVMRRSDDGTWLVVDGSPSEVMQKATSLAVDLAGDLWVGSAGFGVARRRVADGAWQSYRAEPPTKFSWNGGSLEAATVEMRNSRRLAPLGRVEAELIYLGEGCRDLDPPADTDGKIALLSITVPCNRLSTMLSVLAARGAVAAIVSDGSASFRISEFFLEPSVSLPSLWMPGPDAKKLTDRLTSGGGAVRATLPERLPTDNIGVIAVDAAGSRWIGSRAEGQGKAGAMNGGVTIVSNDEGGWRTLSRWRPLQTEDIDPLISSGDFAERRDQIYSLAFGAQGEAWVGSDGGLDHLDASGRAIGSTASGGGGLVDDRVRALTLTTAGDLWVATAEGMSRLATASGLWSTLRADANLASNWLRAGAFDHYGDIWAGAGDDPFLADDMLVGSPPGAAAEGLSYFNHAQGVWSQPLAGAIFGLHADPASDLMWSGDATGVTRIDTMSGRSSREPERPVVWAQIGQQRPLRIPAMELWLSDAAGRLDRDMALWGDLCARDSPLQDVRGKIALAPLDTSTCRFESRFQAVQRQGAVALVMFQTLGETFMFDVDYRNDQLKISGMVVPNSDGFRLQQALQQRDKVTASLRSAPWLPLGILNATDRYDFATDSRGSLWVGGSDSLDRRSPEGTWTSFHTRNSGLGLLGQNNPVVRAITVDASNNKWLGTERAGAIRLGEDDETWTPFTTQSTGGAIPEKPITDIAVDAKDNVWFATAGAGVRRLAADGKTWSSFTRDSTSSASSSVGDPNSDGLPSDQVSVVQPAPDGATWFGTRSGLARLAPDLKTWSTIPTAASVTTLAFDPLGDLWFGTAGLGLTQLSRREPGADCASAMPLSPGAVVDTALDNQADIDLYALKVDKPFSRIELTVPDPDNQLDLALRRSCIGIGSQGRHIGSQGRHIGSQGRHIGSEQRLVFDVLAEAGTYYVEVRPRIGTQDKPIPYRLRSGLTPVDLDSRRTLILTDASAVRNAFGLAADSEEYLAWLDALASLQADASVGGLVITDLKSETNDAVRQAYTAWLTKPDPGETNSLANALVLALRDWIWQRKATDMPRLQYVVLAGDDRILPHFRLAVDKPREGTGWHAESEYLATAGIDPDSTIAAALKDDLVLTDDLYGAPTAAPSAGGTSAIANNSGGSSDLQASAKVIGDALGLVSPAAKDLPIPQMAVGRLVERPSAMTKVIEGFLARRGVTTLSASLVAASGAFEDAARVGASALAETGLAATKRAELLGSSWTQLDLQRTLLAEKRDLFFGAVPGDHASLALPDGRRLEPDTLRASARPLAGLLAVMLASHSGLNAPGPNHIRKLDWPEAWLAQGASLVAPTAYAYGLDGEVHYGEKLAADIMRLAVQGDGRVIGDALVAAKQEYLADAANANAFDAATVAGMVLFGLPMARLEVKSTPAASGAGLLASSWGLDATSDADFADGRTAAAATEVVSGTWAVTVAQAISGVEKKDGPDGSWYAVPGVQPRLVAGEVVQPQLRVDVPELQASGTDARAGVPLRGVLWIGGRSKPVAADFRPWWLGAIASGIGAAAGRPAAVPGMWQPAVPVALRAWRGSEGVGDALVASHSGRLLYAAGQLDAAGTERLFEEIVTEEYYSAAEDVVAPAIKDVKVEARGGELEISAHVEDRGNAAASGGAASGGAGASGVGVLKVIASWTVPGSGEWRSVQLTADGNGTWRGRMPAGASAVVQAVDRAGNATVDDNGGWLW